MDVAFYKGKSYMETLTGDLEMIHNINGLLTEAAKNVQWIPTHRDEDSIDYDGNVNGKTKYIATEAILVTAGSSLMVKITIADLEIYGKLNSD